MRPQRSGVLRLAALWCWLVLLVINLPILVVAIGSFSEESFISFPPAHLSLRWYENYFGSERWIIATLNSLKISILTVVLATPLGILASYGLCRGRFPGRRLVGALFAAPLIVPTVVVAIAVYFAFSQVGLVGTTTGVVLAHAALATPLVVVSINAVLQGFDRDLELAASGLGAGRWQVFWHVTRPLIQPGIASGALFAFLLSFDELVVALFVAGAGSETLPMRMWSALNNEIDPTIAAVSTLLIALSALVILGGGRLRSGLAGRF